MIDNTKDNNMWVEKYRPTELENYIGNETIKNNIKIFLEKGEIGHLLFYSSKPGTGKTSLSKLIVSKLDCDVMYINASMENDINTIRTKVTRFAQTKGLGKWKIIILDEADYLSITGAQPALRNLMEEYSQKTRFILTCNYKERLLEPLVSRCQSYEIYPPSKPDIAAHLDKILEKENVKYKMSDLGLIINKTYPDIRKALNTLQQFTINNELILDSQSVAEQDYMSKCKLILLEEKKKDVAFTKIRQIIVNSKVNDYIPFISYLYDNLSEITKNNLFKEAACILILAECMRFDTQSVNKEINIMDGIIKLLNELYS